MNKAMIFPTNFHYPPFTKVGSSVSC